MPRLRCPLHPRATTPPRWALCCLLALACAPTLASAQTLESSFLGSAWDVPFWRQSALISEMSFGGGTLGGQLARVLDDGGFQFSASMGWRFSLLSVESPLLMQTIQTPVLSHVSLLSWGLRARLHIPIVDALRLTGAFGVYKTWATTCVDDGETDCEESVGDSRFADYSGYALEAAAGLALPILSLWDNTSECAADDDRTRGGFELLLGVEYRRTWYDLQNDRLSRSMHGHIDAIMVTFTMEVLFADFFN